RLDRRPDHSRLHGGRPAGRPQARADHAMAGPVPPHVGRRARDRRLSPQPSAGQERGAGTVRAEGNAFDTGLRHHSRRGLRENARAAALSRDEAGGNKEGRREGALSCRRKAAYLILVSLNSTCLRATGSYFLNVSLSVLVRAFFLVT